MLNAIDINIVSHCKARLYLISDQRTLENEPDHVIPPSFGNISESLSSSESDDDINSQENDDPVINSAHQ